MGESERGEEARGEVFFKRKGERCVKNRSSFCHAAVPPAFLSLPTLTAYVSLPPIPDPLSIHLPLSLLSHLFDLFSPQSPPFLLFPTLSLLLLSMCVRLCKLSRCLSLSLSDVQQLHKESFFFLSQTRTFVLCTRFSLFSQLSLLSCSLFPSSLWWSLTPSSFPESFISGV